MHDFVNTVIADRYTIVRELGRGGMATVWLARDRRYERPVAIKVLHPELAGAIGVDRFIREVRLTAQLQHPSIVPILDSGVLPAADGTSLPWYAMTYLEGESLRARLTREHQLPIDDALRITDAVGGALHAAHQQDIIHRDIKPENVFLADGHVYVVDFGIAKALLEVGSERLTSTGLAIGTPVYMSPEQAMADRIDARSDQYSLATILYEMLAGEPPFSGPTAQAIVARRFAEPARRLKPVRSTVPDAVEQALLRALERAPADRFRDVAEFTTALRGTTSPRWSRVLHRVSARRALMVAGLVAVAVTGGWLLARRDRMNGARTTDPEVLALYQRGVRGYDRRTPIGVAEGISAFNAAIRRDSTYAPAWTGLAKSYVRSYERFFVVEGVSRDSLLQRAVAAVDRAVATDSGSSDAWLTRAMVSKSIDPTSASATLRDVRQAIRRDSTNVQAWHTLAVSLADSGSLSAATDAWRECVRRGPGYTQCVAFLALAHYWHRQYDSAALWADSAIALDPNYLLGRSSAGYIAIERGNTTRSASEFDASRRVSTGVEVVNALAGRALVDARAGRRIEARTLLHRIDSLAVAYHPTPHHTTVYVAQVYVALGEFETALRWLARFETKRDLHYQFHLRCDPPFDPIRGDSRFQAILTVPARPSGNVC